MDISKIDKKILHDVNVQNYLVSKAKKGNIQARDLLLESIKGYIVTIVNMKSPNRTIVEDLMQEVFITLITYAIPNYNADKKVPFRTYAIYWIMASIEHYLNRNLINFPFSVPDNRAYYLRKGDKEKSGIADFKFINKIKSNDGDYTDIFDIVPKDYTENEYIDDTLSKFFDKTLRCFKKEKTRDIMSRYLCLGKYKDYPSYSIAGLSNEYSISNQSLHKRITKGLKQIRTEKLRKVILGVA